MYKYASPHEWLSQKVVNAGEDVLRAMLNAVIPSLDSDTIQDLFQEEMSEDGYFDRMVECPSCRAQSSEEAWNETTEQEYGEDSIRITDGVMTRGCAYVCPENGCHVGIPL